MTYETAATIDQLRQQRSGPTFADLSRRVDASNAESVNQDFDALQRLKYTKSADVNIPSDVFLRTDTHRSDRLHKERKISQTSRNIVAAAQKSKILVEDYSVNKENNSATVKVLDNRNLTYVISVCK